MTTFDEHGRIMSTHYFPPREVYFKHRLQWLRLERRMLYGGKKGRAAFKRERNPWTGGNPMFNPRMSFENAVARILEARREIDDDYSLIDNIHREHRPGWKPDALLLAERASLQKTADLIRKLTL